MKGDLRFNKKHLLKTFTIHHICQEVFGVCVAEKKKTCVLLWFFFPGGGGDEEVPK